MTCEIFSRNLSSFITLFLCCAIAIIVSFPKANAQSSDSTKPSLLQKFWNIGCEFSGVVTRVRRSVPPTPEPNFDDPEELFEYLYPLANENVEEQQDDGSMGSQRSQGSHSLSSWLEDLMELWHEECHYRRSKRSAKRMTTSGRRAQSKSHRTRSLQYNYSRGNNSSLGISPRSGNEGDDVEEDPDYEQYDGDDNPETQENEDVMTRKKPNGKPEKPIVIEKPVEKAEDIFFSQYGGDIEYFFPLLSFGIPFDGEITLLGFHGFRGIFPY